MILPRKENSIINKTKLANLIILFSMFLVSDVIVIACKINNICNFKNTVKGKDDGENEK